MANDGKATETARLRLKNEQLRAENEQLLQAQGLADETSNYNRDLVDGAPLPFVTLDGAGTIRGVNRAAVELLGENDHDLVGRRFRSFVAVADGAAVSEHVRNCPASGERHSCEVRLRNGRPVQLWSRRIRPGTRLYATLIVDVGEREKLAADNRRLAAAERAARAAGIAKDQFIAVLSHELRTPLTPILASVTALTGRTDIPESFRATCEMIRRNVLTEAHLIDDLLDVTRITQGKMNIDRRPVDVHAAAQDAIEMLGSEIAAKRLTATLNLDAHHFCALGDYTRLEQVFWNLIRNAVRFTPEGGLIELRSWNKDAGQKRWLHVEVRDSGRGFAQDAAPQLFEAFEQGGAAHERNGGLGLGLAICKGLMELHGGRIAASSQGPGKGARFVIEIETTDEAPARQEERPVLQPQPTHQRLRILLVDDHKETAESLEEVLTDAHYDVQVAHTVGEALAADLDSIDLLISDIGLPDASGYDLMRSIRGHRPIKGLALSGYGTERDVRASKDAGFTVHLTKPVDIHVLLVAIQQVSASPPP